MGNFGPFTPTEFYSSADKVKFAKQFVRFVEGGFQQSQFPKWFYNQLSNTFGHIAHYNQGGFYATWFTNKADQLRFLERTVEYPCHGQPAFTFSDVERALARWVIESGIAAKLEGEVEQAREAAERAILARLKAKYEQTGAA